MAVPNFFVYTFLRLHTLLRHAGAKTWFKLNTQYFHVKWYVIKILESSFLVKLVQHAHMQTHKWTRWWKQAGHSGLCASTVQTPVLLRWSPPWTRTAVLSINEWLVCICESNTQFADTFTVDFHQLHFCKCSSNVPSRSASPESWMSLATWRAWDCLRYR